MARPFDSTGLPPGATLGATVGVTAAGLGETGITGVGPDTGVSSLPTAAGPLTIGQSFGPRYHIIKLLGAGGMGAVYQAWDAELNVAVALKVIRGHSRRAAAEQEKRFKTELLLARSVTHKNVVRIHDLGEIDGTKYITMSYVQGADLATILRSSGKLPIDRAVRLARQIAAGLEAAHDAGVVHRDLKPANVMVGADDLALIMDFGISASADDAADGGIVGTLEYMAPEQVKGQADARSDVYAFGLVAYELLTGLRVVADPSPPSRVAAMRQRCADGVAPIRAVDPAIPAPLADVIMKCVAVDPAARYANGAAVSAALAQLDEHGQRVAIAARITKPVMAATTLVVALLVGGAFYVARKLAAPVKPHDPVSVVIADFRNGTGDPELTHTVEPMLRRALEGAGFINAYDRTRIRPTFGVKAPDDLDEAAARQLALRQGLGIVVSGAIDRVGGSYQVSIKASETVAGRVLSTAQGRATSREAVLGTAATLAASVRKALGDRTTESAALFARSMSTTSLDVVAQYTAAIEAQSNSRFEDARQHLLSAVQLDPNFGLAYQGLAVVSRNLGRLQDADRYINEALRHLDGMTERERLGTRGLYYRFTGDYQQCVKENSLLIASYAADIGGHNQRALCLSKLRDLGGAVAEMREVVQLVPKRAIYRDNLALYADYAGDYQTAEREIAELSDPDAYATLALAFARLGEGQIAQAAEVYTKLSTLGALGATFAASGLADVALYQGRFSEAARQFDEGAAADLAAKNPDKAARKQVAAAFARFSMGAHDRAVASAEAALATSEAVGIRFLAGRLLAQAGATERAHALADALSAELPAEPQAYGKIVEGNVALQRGDARHAITLFTEANAIIDTWVGHFDLGRAYFALNAFPQADSEFDRCLQRRGEALAFLVDEEPTFGHLPAVYYYQGRVREALRNAGFASSYLEYLNVRGESAEDPLVPEIRRRAGR